jgi:hypothetical protein
MQTSTHDPIKHNLIKLDIKYRALQPNLACAMIIMLRPATWKHFHAKFSSRKTAPIRLNVREIELAFTINLLRWACGPSVFVGCYVLHATATHLICLHNLHSLLHRRNLANNKEWGGDQPWVLGVMLERWGILV